MNSKLTNRSLVVMALFTALLCVSAYISIPLPAGHITLQNFMVLLIAFIFPLNQSVLIHLAWLLLGAVGVPVFIGGNAGLSYIISPWGGYSASFVLIALFIPLVCGKVYNRIYYTILAVIAALLIDVFGAAWLMCLSSLSPVQAALTGILPFIPLDLVKSVVVAQIVPQFKRITIQEQ